MSKLRAYQSYMADCSQFLVNFLASEKLVELRYYDMISQKPIEVEDAEADEEEIKERIKNGLNALGGKQE